MANAVVLPKNRKALVRALRSAADAAATERSLHGVRWMHSYLYLQGVRKFRNYNHERGRVDAVWETSKGKLELELSLINRAIDTEMGRFDAINLEPASRRRTDSLDGLRKASMGQVMFDHMLTTEQVKSVDREVFRNLILYGMCGTNSSVETLGDGVTKVYDVEVIPPWELGAIPADPNSLDEIGAVIRDRKVPLEWIRDVASNQVTVDGDPVFSVPKDDARLESRPVKYGESPTEEQSPAGALGTRSGVHENFDQRDPGDRGETDDTTQFVRLIEVWQINKCDDSLRRYSAIAGTVLLSDRTFGDQKWYESHPDVPRPPPFPIGINQYSVTGSGLYSRGFAEMGIALNSEMEEMLKSITKMVREWDEMGVTYIPGNIGITKRDWKISTKPKQVWYEPDPSTPQARPFQTRPVNAGTTPASVLSLLLSLNDKQMSQSPLLRGEAPGRVDNAAGIATIFQASNISLAGPARSMSSARIRNYRALSYEIKRRWSETDKLTLATIDDSIVGLVVDARNMRVKVEGDGLPWYHEIEIGVKATKQDDNSQKVAMAMQLAQSPKELWIYNYRDNLGLPDMQPRIRESVRTAMLNNVLLYADGKVPGDALLDPDADDMEVLKKVLEDFMARVEFKLAEPEVVEAFKHYLNELESHVGGRLPAQAPDVVQAAVQQQQLAQAMAAQAAQAGQQ